MDIPRNKKERRKFFAAERERLLRLLPKRPRRPVDGLKLLFELHSYSLKYQPLPATCAARTYPERRLVVVCRDLAKKLSYQQAVVGVHAFTLAHELAHVIYHEKLILAKSITDKQEYEADEFAGIFLVPARAIASMKEAINIRKGLLNSNEEIWAATISMAKRLGVSGACMKNQLRELGYIEFDRQLRKMSRGYRV